MYLDNLICPTCIKENGRDLLSASISLNTHLHDSGVYGYECEKGHKNFMRLSIPRYVLLYESGLYALSSGYLRESVASVTAGLERFYENTIRVLSTGNIDNDFLDKLWTSVSNQSERQLGAFIFLYANFTKKNPPILSNSDVRLRNDIIHKGYFPTYEEALKYAFTVFEKISEIHITLAASYGEAMENVWGREDQKQYFKIKELLRVEHYNSPAVHVTCFLQNVMQTEITINELTNWLARLKRSKIRLI